MATSLSIIWASKNASSQVQERSEVQRVAYIHYLIQFGGFQVQALIDLTSKVIVIQLSFVKNLGLHICKMNVRIDKIDSSKLETWGMIIVLVQIDAKNNLSRFYRKIFLLANISRNIAFGIFFLNLSNFEINFTNVKPKKRLYITAEIFLTIRQVELVRMKEVASTVLNPKDEILLVYVTFLVILDTSEVYPFYKA